MKTVFSVLLLAIAVPLTIAHGGEPAAPRAEQGVVRLSEPVEVTQRFEVFGAPVAFDGEALSLAEVVGNSERYLGTEVQVTTRVASVCQKKGCFFIAQDGKAVARVTFKDYEFFIPTDSADKQVTLTGTFTQKVVSAEQAAHLAEDLGKANPGAARAHTEYQIVASSIRIPRS